MQYRESLWMNEFRQYTFDFEGHEAILVFPNAENACKKWLLKTEYFSAFQDLELTLVRRGMHLAYLQNDNRWGTNDTLDLRASFRDFLVREFDLDPKCVPVGMSCGGLQAIKLAARHPEMVSCLYLDAPVVNLLSCPFGFGRGSTIEEPEKKEVLDALRVTPSEMIAYRDHPLDHIPDLLANRIPVVLVCGDADTIVPFDENGEHIRRAYAAGKLPLLFLSKRGCGHHPHGPAAEDMERTADFLFRYA